MQEAASAHLLQHQISEQDVPEDLEEGLDRGPDHDFQHLIDVQPEAVIRYLEKQGTKQLCTFKLPDTAVYPLMRGTGMITMGSHAEAIKHEAAWRDRINLPDDDYEHRHEAKGWVGEVEVEAHVVTIRNAAAADDAGLLNPLLKRWKDGTCSQMVFGLPAVRAVINFKWDRWGYKLLVLQFVLFMVWLLASQVFLLLFQDEDLSLSLSELVQHRRGAGIIASEVVSLLAMAPFVYIEACTVIEFGPKRWLNVWNLIDLITYILQITIDVMHIGRLYVGSETLSLLIAAQCLLLWFRLQFFIRVFQPTKNSFVETLRSVFEDVKWSLLFLVLTIWGFAGAFYILFREDQDRFKEFSTIGRSWLTMFTFMMTVSSFDSEVFYDCSNPEAATALLIFYLFVVAVIFLNLLIGIMADSWKTIKDNEGLRFLCSKAGVIDELEYTIPRWIKNRNPSWYPAYVHVLRINPNSTDEVEMDSMWSRVGVHHSDSVLDDKSELTIKLNKITRQLETNQAALQSIQAALQDITSRKNTEDD